MVMFERAMEVAKLEGTEVNKINQYVDYEDTADWAKEAVKEVIAASVFNGTSDNTLDPKSTLTYAEAAQAIRNLLIKAGLINE